MASVIASGAISARYSAYVRPAIDITSTSLTEKLIIKDN